MIKVSSRQKRAWYQVKKALSFANVIFSFVSRFSWPVRLCWAELRERDEGGSGGGGGLSFSSCSSQQSGKSRPCSKVKHHY